MDPSGKSSKECLLLNNLFPWTYAQGFLILDMQYIKNFIGHTNTSRAMRLIFQLIIIADNTEIGELYS